MKKSLLTGRGFGKLMFHQLKILFGLLLIIGVLVSGCSEDPVSPEPPPPPVDIIDSNFFDWEYFDVYGTNLGGPVYALDTNDILMLGFPRSVRFRNRTIEFTDLGDPDFNPFALNGIGNTVYIGGKSLSKGNIMLKKLEGNSFSNIDIPFDTASQYIGYIYPYSENDIWFITAHRYVYRYHNKELTKYFDGDDTRINRVVLNRSNTNEITAILQIPLIINPPNSIYLYIYKRFENGLWTEINRDTMTSSSKLGYISGLGPNGEVLRGGRDGYVYKFDNGDWMEYINTFNVFFHKAPDFTMGNYDGNVLINGLSINFGNQAWPVLYYSDNQLYYLSDHRVPIDNRRIFGVNYRNGRYSLVYSLIDLFVSKFSIGIPKTKK